MPSPSPLARRAATLAAALLLAACSDDGVRPADPAAPEPEPPAAAIETLRCTASVSPLRLSCASPGTSGGGLNAAIVGQQGVNVFLASSNVAYDPAGDSLTADVTVRSLLSQPMGTTDGVSPDANGVRLFFLAGPTAPVTVAADGTAPFTASNQAYYQYGPTEFGGACCLAPQATSTARRWKFLMNGAASFTFSVQVAAAIPAENGVYRWQTDFDPGAPVNRGDPVLDLSGFFIPEGMQAAGAVGAIAVRQSGAWEYQPLPNGPTDRVLRMYTPIFTNLTWGVAANGTFWRSGGGYQVGWTPVFVGVTGIRDVHGTDSLNVWAVGDSGRVLRSTGRAWGRVAQPGTANLRAVWTASASDVWAAGEGGSLHHWTGSGWTTVAAPDTGTVNDLWGDGPSAIWAVNVQQTGSGPVSSIFFYNGTSWTVQRSGIAAPLRSLHGARPDIYGPNNLYAVGGTRLLRFNGNVWFDEYVPLVPGDSLYSVRVLQPQLAVVGGIGTAYIGTR